MSDSIRDDLESLRRRHHECEDCWYSCPLSEDGCCDDTQKGCNCGAKEHNARLDAVIVKVDRLRAILAGAELASGSAEHVLLYVNMPRAEYEAIKAGR